MLGTCDNTYLLSHVASFTLIHHCFSFRLQMAIYMFHSFINILVVQVFKLSLFQSHQKACTLVKLYNNYLMSRVASFTHYTLLWVLLYRIWLGVKQTFSCYLNFIISFVFFTCFFHYLNAFCNCKEKSAKILRLLQLTAWHNIRCVAWNILPYANAWEVSSCLLLLKYDKYKDFYYTYI